VRTLGRHEADIVAAAQAGDQDALNDLVTAYLPMVYTLVRRGLVDQVDVDDVVQDTMVRAVRDLGSLRTPESFRPWLASIALRQIATQQTRNQSAHERTALLDEQTADLIAGGDVQDAAVARLELTRQRRQLVRASQWLDPDDRSVLSLWWLESAGSLTRAELAEALGVSIAHAGVRVQRMRDQLALCRSITAALDSRPRCPELEEVLTGWDGRPSSVWRKRLGRHVRSCPICGAQEAELLSPEKLLIPFALLPVPLALTAGLAALLVLAAKAAAGGATATIASGAATGVGAVGGGAKVGVLGHLTQLAATHPLIAGVTAVVVVSGTAITVNTLPSAPPEHSVVVAAEPTRTRVPGPVVGPATPAPVRQSPRKATSPSPSTTTHRPSATRTTTSALVLSLNDTSLEWISGPAGFLRSEGEWTFLRDEKQLSDDEARQSATFQVMRGLADKDCYTFRALDGRYLRHASFRLRVMPYEDWNLYRADATFCVREGVTPGTIMLQSFNYPGKFIHRRGDKLWLDDADGSDAFRLESSFRVRSPLTG
jgi:RNA polymerase sigma factor (sigma-70 family)